MKKTRASKRTIVNDYCRLCDVPMGVLLREFQQVKGWEKMTPSTTYQMAEIIVNARYGKRVVKKAMPRTSSAWLA